MMIPKTLPRDPAGRLTALGTGIFGDRWQGRTAKLLKIDRKTLYCWLTDSPPADLDNRLATACRERAKEITAEAGDLKAMARQLEGDRK